MGFKEKLTIFDVIFFKIKPNFQPIFCNYFTNDYFYPEARGIDWADHKVCMEQ